MITNLENNAVQLSATKKDFYQIWSEILELAGKISERWDPTSTNESDPGIVLLKVITAVADKLNYTIDANILEAFMPSAAQEESMRKLTEMLGYSMKYYQSATTKVKITYNTSGNDTIKDNLIIDRFTNIKDRDDTINYVTLKSVSLSTGKTTAEVDCIEGELVECETDDDNIISLLQLDDNNRYFLPETQIAENGIFVTNVSDDNESDDWVKVDSLNTQNIKTKCFKFGFDSREGLPYIQFPDDIANIIEDGLKIKYIRTNGVNGNISINTLVKMEDPKSWGNVTSNENTNKQNNEDYYNVDNYTVSNLFASTNGRNKESINDAYNSYKKTIGTFDTLVTCRDYMNKIYQMTFDDTNTTNLVSNIIVSDIRDDINKAFTLCTFNDHGIAYVNKAKPIVLTDATSISQAAYNSLNQDDLEEAFTNNIIYKVYKDNTDPDIDTNVLFYAKPIWDGQEFSTVKINTSEITHFDLVLYPFKNVYGLNSKAEYTKSFKYDDSNLTEIKQNLETNKTMSHNFVAPDDDEITCIKNYLKLNAKITTVRRVNTIEQANILANVFSSLYANFNMRKVDFGEEIPYDSILSIIENSDSRIKNVSLEEPSLVTKFCTVGGAEHSLLNKVVSEDDQFSSQAGKQYYNKLVLNNVLAGRIPLFNYDENFKAEYTESKYGAGTDPENPSSEPINYSLIYPDSLDDQSKLIYRLKPEFDIKAGTKDYKLQDNEVIQFRLPNLKTDKTFPAYVNYFIKLNELTDEDVKVIPATMQTLRDFILLNTNVPNNETADEATPWNNLVDTASGGVGTSVLNELIIAGPDTPEEPTDPITTWTAFDTILNNYTKIGTVLYYYNNFTHKYLYTTNGMFTWTSLDDHGENKLYISFAEWKEKDAETQAKYSPILTYSYPTVKTDDNGVSFNAWYSWVKNMTDASGNPTSNGQKYEVYTKLDGIYITKGQDVNTSCGKLVDINHVKYKLTPQAYNTDKPLLYYYIPKTWPTDEEESDIVEERHTKDGLGQNGKYAGIKARSEYRLQPGEYLLINYTSSKTVDDEETKTIINDYFKPGTIIKPNFDLIDSTKYRETHSYSKTTGYDFSEFLADGVAKPDGMFTLGVNEQIEVRDFAKIYLDEMSSNIYWELQTEVPDSNGRVFFNWDEDPVIIDGKTVYLSHTLKDGEYFYYTNKDKTDIAYYGSGTKITKSLDTPIIYKYIKDTAVSTDDIMTYGLSASIPWRPYDFSKSNGLEKKLSITEYKYINLIKDNTLNTVKKDNTNTDATNIEIDIGSDKWESIDMATYTIEDTIYTLDTVDFRNSSSIEDKTISWEVRSNLNLDVGPDMSQTLHTTFMNDGSVSTIDKITLINKGGLPIITLKALSDTAPLTIKTNKILQGSFVDLDVTTKEYTEDGQLIKTTPDLQIKLFDVSNVTAADSTVNFNNFGDGDFTRLSFEDAQSSAIPFTTLNAIIPENKFGLIMFYNNKVGASSQNIGIRFIKPYIGATVPASPKIYNYAYLNDNEYEYWWNSSDPIVKPDGCIEIISTWAVEASPFRKLSPAEFNKLKATGSLYKRTEAIAQPPYAAFKRWDAETYKLYEYTAITSGYVFDQTKEYGCLSNTGSSSTWAVESTEYPFNKTRTKEEIDELLDGGITVYIRTYTTWAPTPTAYENFDYITYTLYTYTLVESSDQQIETAYYGQLLDEGGTSNIYRLRSGINIVQVTDSCKIEIYPDLNKEDVLVFSGLDIINKKISTMLEETTWLNQKLCYKGIDKFEGNILTPEAQILKDINKLDIKHNFYYNTIIDNASSIDLNETDEDDTLENPLNWYNYNNINNKFVISEIDADALKDNVVIAKSSRI